MPLTYLIDTFNDVFVHEHYFSFRPFVLNNGKVSGLFGPLRIDSVFSPIRKTANLTEIVSVYADIDVEVNNNRLLQENEIIDLLSDKPNYHSNLESIISFDRLARTVHVLNYLTLLPVHRLLFLDVDPRHILGIETNHGIYFQEFIHKAGLETASVVVVLTVYEQYAKYYDELLAGLENYRQQGYQVALRFDSFPQTNTLSDLVLSIFPEYVSLSARAFEPDKSDSIKATLSEFTALANLVKCKTLLQQVDHKQHDLLARHSGFDLVEGGFYRSIPHDYQRNHAEPETAITPSRMVRQRVG